MRECTLDLLTHFSCMSLRKIDNNLIILLCITHIFVRVFDSKLFVDFQGSNDAVLGLVFNPYNTNTFVSYGRSHIAFWTITENMKIVKKMGIFEVGTLTSCFPLIFIKFRIRNVSCISLFMCRSDRK